MKEFSKYVGLDTHKETIAVAVADAMGGKSCFYGEIANTPEAIRKLVKHLCPDGEVLSFCYLISDEAQPFSTNSLGGCRLLPRPAANEAA